jgi:uncharacterized damage-inducible protein DinB
MALHEPLLKEFKAEGMLTRKMLERVPFDNTDWTPHQKSMTIQRLSSHIAEIPIWMTRIVQAEEFDFQAQRMERFFARDNAELLQKFDDMHAGATRVLQSASDEQLNFKWILRSGERIYYTLSRMIVIRNFVFSHIIHHRGQLSVYLRLNNIPVPGMYGPSADETI